MRKVSPEDLTTLDFSIRFVNSLQQFWRKTKVYQQSVPKVHNNLVLLHKCNAAYTLPSSERFTAHSGDIIFAPKDSMYTLELSDFDPKDGCTIGINLHLYDAQGEELLVSDKPFLAASGENPALQALFFRINETAMDYTPCMTRIYSDLYHVFSSIGNENIRQTHIGSKFASIADAIAQLRSDDAYTVSIAEMAQNCHVSESYLRRQFKLYSGMSPVRYIRQRKLLAAKNLLQYTDLSIDEIAYRLHFTDSSYFCKIFRQETGLPPLQYRKQYGAT